MDHIVEREGLEAAESFLTAAANPQSYRNIGYLLLAFPLGLAYLAYVAVVFAAAPVLLVAAAVALWRAQSPAGFAGLPLLILLGIAGLPLLLAAVGSTRHLAAFERRLVASFLGQAITPAVPAPAREAAFSRRLLASLTDPDTVRSLAYLVVKFPLGVLSLVAAVGALLLPATLLTAPFLYRVQTDLLDVGVARVNTLEEALLCVLLAPLAALICLNLTNALAWASRELASLLLSPWDPTVPDRA